MPTNLLVTRRGTINPTAMLNQQPAILEVLILMVVVVDLQQQHLTPKCCLGCG